MADDLDVLRPPVTFTSPGNLMLQWRVSADGQRVRFDLTRDVYRRILEEQADWWHAQTIRWRPA